MTGITDVNVIITRETTPVTQAGFDVALRVCSQISIDIEQIEAVRVNETEYPTEMKEIL